MNVTPQNTMGPMGGFGYLVGGSPLRHHLGVTGQIPAPYAKLKNPLPPTSQNAQLGAAVYDADCASCHGATGLGDGAASRTLTPPPAQLGWLAKIPPSKRDAFMYWSIADGGANFKTGMPGFKGKLSDEKIWAVIGYIQARLPVPKTAR
jgi:mono/diheme cytochrome c family protein